MATIEHLPSAPKQLMSNLRSCLKPDGQLILDTPNIGYWPNRLRAMHGQSIHHTYEVYFGSRRRSWATIATTRHQSWRDLFHRTGFALKELLTFNYSADLRAAGLLTRIRLLALYIWPTLLFPDCREVILAVASPSYPVGPLAVTEGCRMAFSRIANGPQPDRPDGTPNNSAHS